MRFSIAYYLVLLYTTLMFKPFVPVIMNTLSHCFSEANHVSTIHSLYGCNHLEKEVSNTADLANGKRQTRVNNEDPAPDHVTGNPCTHALCCYGTAIPYFSLQLYKLRPGFILKNFPPPKF